MEPGRGRVLLRRTVIAAAVLVFAFMAAVQRQAPLAAGPLQPEQAGLIVRLQVGWNLVALPPGSLPPPGVSALYTQPARLDRYDLVPVGAGEELMSGWGYWLYSAADADLRLATGLPSFSIIVPARQWVLVGNPSGTGTATLTGADYAYIYDPQSGFALATSLKPGQAAWVYNNINRTVRLSVGPPQTVTVQ